MPETTPRQLPKTTIPLCLCFVFVLLLSFLELPYYPRTESDEGLFLLFLRTWSETGLLGIQDASTFEYFIYPHWITNGPAVYLPIMLLFRCFGPSLFLGRFVCSLFIVLLAYILYVLSKRLFRDELHHRILLILMLLSPIAFFYGRVVKGEIPGTFYLLTGLFYWINKPQGTRSRYLLSGVFFGFSMLSKPAFALIIPALLLDMILQMLVKQRVHFSRYVYAIIASASTISVWFIYVVLSQGTEVFFSGVPNIFAQSHIQSYGQLGTTASTMRAENTLTNPFSVLSIISFIYTAYRTLQTRRYEILIFHSYYFMNLIYVITGGGHFRKLSPALIVSYLFMAQFIFDAARYVFRDRMMRRLSSNALFATIISASFLFNISIMYAKKSDIAQKVSDYIVEHLPPHATIYVRPNHIAFLSNRQEIVLHFLGDWRYLELPFWEKFGHFDYLILDGNDYSRIVKEITNEDTFLKFYELQETFHDAPALGIQLDLMIYRKRTSAQTESTGVDCSADLAVLEDSLGDLLVRIVNIKA